MTGWGTVVLLGAALVVTAGLLAAGADRGDLHRRMPTQMPSPGFVRLAAGVGVALVALGLVGLVVG